MTSNGNISAVFKDFFMVFFPEKGEGPHFQKNNIVVPRKATKATKTTKIEFGDLTAKIGEVGKCGRGSLEEPVFWGSGGPDGMYLRAIWVCCPGKIGR